MKRAAALALAALVPTGAAALAPSAGPAHDASWRTVDGGGGTSTAAPFELSGTIGQPDPGTSTGGVWTLHGGFWTAPLAPPCPGDLDDSGMIDFDDLLAVLAAWGNEGGPEDLDGSGTVDFEDLLIVLAGWGACP